MRLSFKICIWAGLLIGVSASAASAEPNTIDAQDFLTVMDLSKKEIATAKAGEIITGSADASNERELVATMAFIVEDSAPEELVERGESGLLDKIDEHTIAFAMLPDDPTLEDFAELKLRKEDLEAFARAESGDELNLSEEEIAKVQGLGKDASAEQIEGFVREAMLARVQAYKAKGLEGIPLYDREGAIDRAAGEELMTATIAAKAVKTIAPMTYEVLIGYPKSKPPGTEEAYRWSYIDAHDEPTIVLTHSLYVPEGGSWMVVQRQFYVSRGYNCEQAIAAFVPVTEGTAVFYINRTSTDQVAGFGGGAKRSIGSKLLASELEALYSKVQDTAESK